jgi:hypothetical protein
VWGLALLAAALLLVRAEFPSWFSYERHIAFAHPLSTQLDDMMRSSADALVIGDADFVARMREQEALLGSSVHYLELPQVDLYALVEIAPAVLRSSASLVVIESIPAYWAGEAYMAAQPPRAAVQAALQHVRQIEPTPFDPPPTGRDYVISPPTQPFDLAEARRLVFDNYSGYWREIDDCLLWVTNEQLLAEASPEFQEAYRTTFDDPAETHPNIGHVGAVEDAPPLLRQCRTQKSLVAQGASGSPYCEVSTIEREYALYFGREEPDTPLRRAMGFAGDADAMFTESRVGSPPQAIVGYPQEFSIRRGESLEVRYAGELVQLGDHLERAEIFDGHTHQSVLRQDYEPGSAPLERQTCESWYGGCDFSASLSLDTTDLASGAYYVFLTDDRGAQSAPIYFHIAPSRAEVAEADVVVLYAELTWYAYNYYGGGSLYGILGFNADGQAVSTLEQSSALYAASMRRPLLTDPADVRPTFLSQAEVDRYFANPASRDQGSLAFKGYDRIAWLRRSPESHLVFSRLLRENDYRTVTVAQTDIDRDPELLLGAKLLLVSGHNEYWTAPMIDAVLSYVEQGGRIANFSGNVMWWWIRLEDGTIYQDQVGASRPEACRALVPEPFQGTGLLYALSNNLPDRPFGVSYRFANYPLSTAANIGASDLEAIYQVRLEDLDMSRGAGVVVTRPDHPLFEGVSLEAGERLGGDTGILAVELDGAPLTTNGEVDRSMDSALSNDLAVLATATTFVATRLWSTDGDAYVGVRDVGLVVETAPLGDRSRARTISFGTIGYAHALAAKDLRFERIVLNAVDYLSHEDLPPVRR